MTQAYDAKAGNAAAWIATNDGRGSLHWTESDAQFEARLTGGDVQPLYTHPPQSQGVPEGWRSVIQGAIDELGIMDESEGVAGWHLNGAIASWDESGLPAIRDALVELLSTPAAPQADEWVKCADRLPEKGVVVLVFVDYAYHAIKPSTLTAHWTGSTFKIGPNSVNFNCDAPVVTHWMPLPQPPEQGDGL